LLKPTAAPLRLALVLAALAGLARADDEPDWVRKRPVVDGSYVGIGMARKSGPAAEYVEAARNVARNDIAGQISVKVSSEVLRTVLEKNEQVREEFTSSIRASTTAEMENLELVDTYESDQEYWVYLRLSRAEFEARRRARLEAASGQAIDLYVRGGERERSGEAARAIGLYAQALVPLERYLGEPITADLEGSQVYLLNEIYGSLRSLLERTAVKPVVPELEATIGRPLTQPLEVAARLTGPRPAPVAGLPVRFSFTRGAGELLERGETDLQGIARCAVRKVTSSERIQSVEAALDLQALAGGESVPPAVRALLRSLPLPHASFVLNVSGMDVYLWCDERMFGATEVQKRIEPLLKSELEPRGYVFVEEKSRAALAITIRADVRKGQETHGLAFAYASGSVSVTDLETGREVFASAINDVKEGSDSFEKAGARSLSALGRRMASELIPRITEKTQR
jgi:hypothetical protein